MGLRIGRLLIFATDIEEAARFYGDVLGMDSLGQTSRRVSFAGDGFVLDAYEARRLVTGNLTLLALDRRSPSRSIRSIIQSASSKSEEWCSSVLSQRLMS